MAPEVATRVTGALYDGQLSLIAAKVIQIEPNGAGAAVTYRLRGNAETRQLQAGAVVDCTGIVKDPRATPNPAVRSLFQQGLACVDPLCVGIETDPDCAIVDREGVPSRRLFAVGPLTRATFWEIIAIPDIRNQCAELAALLSRTEETGQHPLRRELTRA